MERMVIKEVAPHHCIAYAGQFCNFVRDPFWSLADACRLSILLNPVVGPHWLRRFCWGKESDYNTDS
jgi:hypothetical protein